MDLEHAKKHKRLTLLDHLLQTPIRINLHRIQIGKPVNLSRFLAKLLRKGVGQIVRWVR